MSMVVYNSHHFVPDCGQEVLVDPIEVGQVVLDAPHLVLLFQDLIFGALLH